MDSATEIIRAAGVGQPGADTLGQLERKIQEIQDTVLIPVAERTKFDLSPRRGEAVSTPSVLFLGNHSSGKSSFINYLIEADVQKTGLAPTDDGFTFITYGEGQDEIDGQTVVTHRDFPFRDLERFGPAFVSRLRLKTYPHPLLKSVSLIDSPGMIDAAGSGNTRGYDFSAAVRRFAERADLILFFFDPDKPGTTGETVANVTATLAGLEHKLMIVLHKVDLFHNMRDFARTYGTLCWNLAKAIQTKDIPHIYNTYLPNLTRSDAASQVPLQDFDLSREEVVKEIGRAPTRRTDNLVSELHQATTRLSVHAQVCTEVGRRNRELGLKWLGATAIVVVLSALVTWLLWDVGSWKTRVISILAGVILTASLWGLSREVLKRFAARVATLEGLEPFFEQAFRSELILRDREDLRATWRNVQHQTIAALKVLGPGKLHRAIATRRSLKRLERVLSKDVPGMRREVAAFHTEFQAVKASEG